MHEPDFDAGVSYWHNTPATVTGVMGGFGETTPVPRLDAAASRLLLLSLFPTLSTIQPVHRRSATANASPPPSVGPQRLYKALDCGAGIGRVTATVLLPLFHQVDLVEPVAKFLDAARDAARKASKDGWKLLAARATVVESPDASSDSATSGTEFGRRVRLWRAGLQHFDPVRPALPLDGGESTLVASIASDNVPSPPPFPDPSVELDAGAEGYDVVWIQWCIGHLSDAALVAFLKRARAATRNDGYIVVKENTCKDDEAEGAGRVFDEDDSSWTRSDKVFRKVFSDSGLELVRREVQKGFPIELYPVVTYVLR